MNKNFKSFNIKQNSKTELRTENILSNEKTRNMILVQPFNPNDNTKDTKTHSENRQINRKKYYLADDNN